MLRLLARPVVPLALVALTALSTGACSDNTLSQLASASTTATQTFTDTYTGTLSTNGAFQHLFTIQTLGAVTVTLVSTSPNTAQVLGMSLGVWTGTQCSTSPQTGGASNDQATAGTVITLNATAAGNLCARLYDVGFITQPVFYTLTITHP